MAEKREYPSNSKKDKEQAEPQSDRKKLERVTTSDPIVRKPRFGRRFLDAIGGEDATTVGGYILFDVIIPSTKSLISDVVSQGIERMLFGESSPRRRSSGSRSSSGRSNYRDRYPGRNFDDRDDRDRGRSISSRGRATHSFDEIEIESRGEATDILDQLIEMVDTADVASIADYYDLVGITGTFQDERWGWSNLSEAQIRPRGRNYVIVLPKPEYLE